MVDWLSQNVGIGKGIFKDKSVAMYCNHCNSQATVAKALYLASVELRETVFYFLDFHDIKQWP